MVVMEPSGRYRLLETMRHFATGRLAGDASRLDQAHLRYYTSLAVQVHDGLQGAHQTDWLDRMRADWSNLRAAYARARATADVVAAATIVCHLFWAAVWHDVGEPYAWIEDVAKMDGASQSEGLAPHTGRPCTWPWESGRNEEALRLGLEALAAEPAGESTIDYLGEYAVLAASYFMADVERTRIYLDRVIERSRADGRPVTNPSSGPRTRFSTLGRDNLTMH